MENPTFRLEGIVKSKDEMEDFEGPLTLILLLLSKNKIEIRNVQISVILEQYLEYLDQMKKMDLEVASEFVAMASNLMYIKAKTLLAADSEQPVSELEMLMSSLEELQRKDGYARIKFAAEFLSALRDKGAGYYTKPPEPVPGGEYAYSHSKEDLEKAILSVLNRDDPGFAVTALSLAVPGKITYSVTQKTEEILALLKTRGTISVRELLCESKSRSEVVATFVSVLELCKMGSIIFIGSDENLTVSSTGN